MAFRLTGSTATMKRLFKRILECRNDETKRIKKRDTKRLGRVRARVRLKWWREDDDVSRFALDFVSRSSGTTQTDTRKVRPLQPILPQALSLFCNNLSPAQVQNRETHSQLFCHIRVPFIQNRRLRTICASNIAHT